MDCHRCRYNSRVNAGQYHDVAWEKTPCSKCAPEKNPTHMNEYCDEMDTPTDGGRADPEAMMPISVLGEFVAGLMRLKPSLRDAVCLRYNRMSFVEIGIALGIDEDGAETRVRRAVEIWPALREVLPREFVRRRDNDGNRVCTDRMDETLRLKKARKSAKVA